MPPTVEAEKPQGPKGPSLAYRHNVADGQHEIGVKSGKLFVPFTSVSDARFAQLVEYAENRAANDAASEGEEG